MTRQPDAPMHVPGGVAAPRGFRAAGVACGIKKNDQPDLALLNHRLVVLEDVFDGILQSDDVLAAVAVDVLEHRGEVALGGFAVLFSLGVGVLSALALS